MKFCLTYFPLESLTLHFGKQRDKVTFYSGS